MSSICVCVCVCIIAAFHFATSPLKPAALAPTMNFYHMFIFLIQKWLAKQSEAGRQQQQQQQQKRINEKHLSVKIKATSSEQSLMHVEVSVDKNTHNEYTNCIHK